MADTNSSGTNAKHVASAYREATGGELEPRRAPIIDIATGLETGPGVLSQDRIEARRLYEFFSVETGKFEVDVPVAIISETLATSLQRVRSALAEANELEKENHISLAWSNVLGLARFIGVWPAFDEAVSLLFTAFEVHRAAPYNPPELIALQKVLEMLRRNPLPTDTEINVIYESLEAAHFDLNAPLAGVNLDESPEEL
ncbi:MAG TPA: hypothetical protein VK775_07340 [Chthoniobacterales bacterium]|jgi:hypothetical protein|nr:hypothetical protein [Chthoniobacterales bacterium]